MKKLIAFLAIVALLGLTGVANAGWTTTPDYWSDLNHQPQSATDLANSDQSSYSSITGTAAAYGGQSLANLVDGYNPTIGTGDTTGTYTPSGDSGQVTVTFAGTNGYYISEIAVLAGQSAGPGHYGYDYEVEYATVSAPTTWLSAFSSSSSDAGLFYVHSTPDVGDPILTAPVIALRWTINDGEGGLYREFDVFGSEVPPIPEPAGLGLLGVALLGLRRRRS